MVMAEEQQASQVPEGVFQLQEVAVVLKALLQQAVQRVRVILSMVVLVGQARVTVPEEAVVQEMLLQELMVQTPVQHQEEQEARMLLHIRAAMAGLHKLLLTETEMPE
jgi:orotate phosphoribosyltransferase-like protein